MTSQQATPHHKLIRSHPIALHHFTTDDSSSHERTSHDIAVHHVTSTTQEIASHKMKTHQITSHDMTWHLATNHIPSPRVISQPTTLLHLAPQATSWHQNRSHHHHGTAEGSFTAKKWFGHRAGRSPCAHSIGKFFLCYIVLFLLETSAPGLSGHYW